MPKSLQQTGLEALSQIQFYPEDFRGRAENFLQNIRAWCISRDLIWGHKIPIWYNLDINPTKKFFSYEEIKKMDENSQLPIKVQPEKPTETGNWVQEEKILDTWFSSCLWPLSTLSYANNTNSKKFAKPIIIHIHGGDSYGNYLDKTSYDLYLESLKNKTVNLETSSSWKVELKTDLEKNEDCLVYLAKMPNKQNAHYVEWSIWFEKILASLKESKEADLQNLTLIGHSLGGIFLAKYLSENKLEVQNLHLIAAPFEPVGDFELQPELLANIQKQTKEIYIYHSTDDQIVDYSEALSYQKYLTNAKTISFEDKGHFIDETFVELNSVIKQDLEAAKNSKLEADPVATHTILMPPPNLTGPLHAGHAFQHFFSDTLMRIYRQQGKIGLWYPGVDHAGIQLEGVINKMIVSGDLDEELMKF